VLRRAPDVAPDDLATVFDDLVREAKQVLERERIPEDRRAVELSLDVRYYGQTPYINLPLDAPPATEADLEALLDRYESRYLQEFGYVLPRDFATIEFVNARVVALGITERVRLPRSDSAGSADDARSGNRQVYFDEAAEFVPTAVYDRSRLHRGATFDGPAVVEQADSTVLLPPGASAEVDEYLNLVITVDGR
jgi:N-methylhydantoinase A